MTAQVLALLSAAAQSSGSQVQAHPIQALHDTSIIGH